MEPKNTKTYSAKPGEVERKWYHVDADGQILGRLATKIARALLGKTKPQYTPHVDVGDFVVVTNCEKVRVTGKKAQYSQYERYSGYPGGLKVIPFEEMLQKHPERVVYFAVKRMMPRSKLGRQQLKKLKIYKGPDHPHAAQQPEPFPW